jgi:hypothetical protein
MYPFYAKDTFGLNYYKVNSEFEGLKVGKFTIEMYFKELDKIVKWKKTDKPNYIDLIPIDKEAFNEHFIQVQEEINRQLTKI